jgi:hypothetical protein
MFRHKVWGAPLSLVGPYCGMRNPGGVDARPRKAECRQQQ